MQFTEREYIGTVKRWGSGQAIHTDAKAISEDFYGAEFYSVKISKMREGSVKAQYIARFYTNREMSLPLKIVTVCGFVDGDTVVMRIRPATKDEVYSAQRVGYLGISTPRKPKKKKTENKPKAKGTGKRGRPKKVEITDKEMFNYNKLVNEMCGSPKAQEKVAGDVANTLKDVEDYEQGKSYEIQAVDIPIDDLVKININQTALKKLVKKLVKEVLTEQLIGE